MKRLIDEECCNGNKELKELVEKCEEKENIRYELLCAIRRKIMPINVL